MKGLDLAGRERQLKTRWQLPYNWGRKQNDHWDRLSGFIYQTETWESLFESSAKVSLRNQLDQQHFLDYCANRWYNFWSAKSVEEIFSRQQGVVPAIDSRDRLIDFRIKDTAFDHKTSVYPAGFRHPLKLAQEQPELLIRWLYLNQSSGQRQHFGNRLFLIVCDKNGEHWKLKAEIEWLKELIEKHVATFEPSQLKSFEFIPGKITCSDIIWAVK